MQNSKKQVQLIIKPENHQLQRKKEIDIEQVVSEFPSLSITKIEQATKAPWTVTRNILRKRLNRKPFKIPVSHRLLDPDYA